MRRRSQSSILSALLVSADNRKWENRSVASLTAVPFRQKISHLFTQIKRHGALFAKGWLIALQFEVLFSNGLYQEIGDLGNRYAGLIKEIMKTCGYRQYVDSPTNQQFFILPNRIEIFFHASVSRTEFRNSLFVIGSMSLGVFNVYNAKVE